MTYRILVDENTSPRVATTLTNRGYDAIHILDALESGASDQRIVDYASEHGFVVLTNDTDFLNPEFSQHVRVLYYGDETMQSSEIVGRVEQIVRYVPEQQDLSSITDLGAWK